MDYLSATSQATRGVRATTGAEDTAIRAALALCLHAWQHCTSRGAAAARWDLFGTDVHAAADLLHPAADPLAVIIDEPTLPDTAATRAATVALVTAVATHLTVAAGDPTADPRRRWRYSDVAARLARAAAELGVSP